MVMVVVVAARESTFFFCFQLSVCCHPSLHQMIQIPGVRDVECLLHRMGMEVPISCMSASGCYCGVGSSVHFGLAVVGVALVFVATVVLAQGNEAQTFAGLFAFGEANLLTLGFLTLDLPFFCLFSLDLFGKGLLLVNELGFGWNRLFYLFLLLIHLYFLLHRRKQFHPSTPGDAGSCFNSVIFFKHVDSLDCSYS